MSPVLAAAVLLCALSLGQASIDRQLQRDVIAELQRAACPYCHLCVARETCKRAVGRPVCNILCGICKHADCDAVPPTEEPTEPVDGQWSAWGSWSGCDVTCGTGTQTRRRTCTDPAPENGGAPCPGDETGVQACQTGVTCPGEPSGPRWRNDGRCGPRYPAPGATPGECDPNSNGPCCSEYGYCGSSGDHCTCASCVDYRLPSVDGGWAAWGAWSACRGLCGAGRELRSRACSNPAPQNGGAACAGDGTEERECDTGVVCPPPDTRTYRRVCYHTNWAQYRQAPATFVPEDIDPWLCTHIMYAFAILDGNRLKAYEANDESTLSLTGMYERTHDLKDINPDLKVSLAVGGWNVGSGPFSDMVSTRANRAEFVTTSIAFLRQWEFDGLDLDWEYPAQREGSRPEDKQRFTFLVQELKAAFEAEVLQAGQERLLLSAAVPAGESNVLAGYEIDLISEHLDFINLMTYDLHGSWEAVTGLNSPLYPAAVESGYARKLNQQAAVQVWRAGGAPAHKLTLGIGLYGRSFTLSSGDTGLRAPAGGGGTPAQYTAEAGYISYYEICSMLSSGATRVFDEEQKAPYAYLGNQWVGYDDDESIGHKVDFLKQEGLGGAMVWALDLDDFSGQFCNQGNYPLMNSIKDRLEMGSFNASQAVNGSWTSWGPWSGCGVTCGAGTRTRRRSCTDPPPQYGGTPCPGHGEETQPCDTGQTCPEPVESPYRRVCYFASWAHYRSAPVGVAPGDLGQHAGLCSHLIYSFVNMEDNQLTPFDNYDETTGYAAFNSLKSSHPGLKTLLAIGGWTFGSLKFSNMAATAANRAEFVSSAVGFLRQRDFDGLDLDWEYPAHRDGRPEDKQNFPILIRELKEAFVAEGASTGRERLLLTAAVAASGSTVDTAYDIPAISQHLDFINVMTYDFHAHYDGVTGLNSPLFGASSESPSYAHLNSASAIQQWTDGGAPPAKLTLGIGLYGRSFTLADSNNAGLRAPSAGAGTAGPYSSDPGYLIYYEICTMLSSGATRVFDGEQKAPYAYLGNQWVGYDDEESIEEKINWMKQRNLGGWMVWSIDQDDVSGSFCGGKQYPLMNRLNQALDLPVVNTTAPPPVSGGSKWREDGRCGQLFPAPGATPGECDPNSNYPCCSEYGYCGASSDHCGCANCVDYRSTPGPAVDGGWTDWTSWSSCSVTCGSGTETRTRACSNPAPQHGGAACTGDGSEERSCETGVTCPDAEEEYDPENFCADKATGFYADPQDCQKYFQCANGITYHQTCWEGTLWSQSLNNCDWEDNVVCNNNR